MDVILLEKINKLGNLGDKATVKAGFGRNYLIPQGKAVPANKENIEKFEARRAELEKAAKDALNEAKSRVEVLEGKVINIIAKTGGEGRLFGSIGSIDIVEHANKENLKIERNEIRLPTGPIRQIGEYDIPLTLHPDVKTTIKVIISEDV